MLERSPDSGGQNWSSESRDHNDANELVERGNFEITYDKAGNMVVQESEIIIGIDSEPVTMYYTYDAWNRLVKIGYNTNDRAEYRYNGLNWRVEKFSDTSLPRDGELNERRQMFYNGQWQLVEERIQDFEYSDPNGGEPEPPVAVGPEVKVEYIWGLRYIDDIVMRHAEVVDEDPEDPEDPDHPVGTWYHLTDAQFSTVAIVNERGGLVERVSYDAYGRM